MTYWRMQLHPSNSSRASEYAARSLSAGFIGLDFWNEPGDLTLGDPQTVQQAQRGYFGFANEMKIGDKVLIISHHFPFAVCTVSGDYNYIRREVKELGIWFKHFREVTDIKLYSDKITNAKNWQKIVMPNTISPLRDTNCKSYQLIDNW